MKCSLYFVLLEIYGATELTSRHWQYRTATQDDDDDDDDDDAAHVGARRFYDHRRTNATAI